MEFLRQSQRKQRRRLQIEELILLSLRMLIVALRRSRFARPVLRASASRCSRRTPASMR